MTALKVVLGLVGLIFLLSAWPLVLFIREDPAMSMMFSLYVTLGIFLLLAVAESLGESRADRVHRVGFQAFRPNKRTKQWPGFSRC